MQQRVAQALRFGSGQIAFETESFHPDQEVRGDEDGDEPGGVDGEAGRGEVGEPGVLGVADAAFATSPAAIESFDETEVGPG